MMTLTPPSTYRESNSTADRALAILQMFNENRQLLSAVDVAEGLGVARSTAYRYLQTLVTSQFLEEDPGKGFRLGPKILELARIARRSHGLSELAIPVMRELAETFHETVLLTKRIGNSIVCLEREESVRQYVRFSYERGSQLSINAGASALILIAWLPEEAVRELLQGQELRRMTPSTLVDVDVIVERLKKIREDGYAITMGEVDPEAMGVAVPVFGSSGVVVAGLSIVLIQSRLPKDALPNMLEELKRAGATLSERFELFGH